MAKAIEVRPCTEADVVALAEIFTAAVHHSTAAHYDAAQREAWAPRPSDFQRWHQRLLQAQLHTLVAIHDAVYAGFISYEPDGHIEYLYTAPAAQRHGIASALYRAAERELSGTGVKELYTESSLIAQPFFMKQGFHTVEEQSVGVRGVAFRRYAMRKILADHLER